MLDACTHLYMYVSTDVRTDLRTPSSKLMTTWSLGLVGQKVIILPQNIYNTVVFLPVPILENLDTS